MTKKFDDFIFYLEQLCREHEVQLASDTYDGLGVWDLNEGEAPLYFPDIEDCTEEMKNETGTLMTKREPYGMSKSFVVVQQVWVQVSSDCDTVGRFRTIVVTPETTVGEVMRWAAVGRVIGRSDVVLTEQDSEA